MDIDSGTVQCNGVRKLFGGIPAVDGVTLSIPFGKITGVIGPNGSGKTTLIDVISGYLKPDGGEVTLGGVRITGMSPFKISRLGLGRTFQIAKSFFDMSVIENLVVANPGGVSKAAFQHAESILAALNLSLLRDEKARSLSYGQQKLLGVGRLMMTHPKTVIMDEPFSGINPVIQEKIVSLLEKFRESAGILLVEHDMKMISRICDRVIALDQGRLIAEGTPEQVLKNESVIESYLGSGK